MSIPFITQPLKGGPHHGVRSLFAVVSSIMVREQLRAKFCGGRINWFVLIRTSPIHVQYILREKSKRF